MICKLPASGQGYWKPGHTRQMCIDWGEVEGAARLRQSISSWQQACLLGRSYARSRVPQRELGQGNGLES